MKRCEVMRKWCKKIEIEIFDKWLIPLDRVTYGHYAIAVGSGGSIFFVSLFLTMPLKLSEFNDAKFLPKDYLQICSDPKFHKLIRYCRENTN